MIYFGRVPLQTTSKPRPNASKTLKQVHGMFENASKIGRFWTRMFLKRVQINGFIISSLNAFGRGGRVKTPKLGDTLFFYFQKSLRRSVIAFSDLLSLPGVVPGGVLLQSLLKNDQKWS